MGSGTYGDTVEILKRYRIPVFLFVNKMDQKGTDREAVLASLKERLDQGSWISAGCPETVIYLGTSDKTAEEIATAMKHFWKLIWQTAALKTVDVRNAIQNRKSFPAFSATPGFKAHRRSGNF